MLPRTPGLLPPALLGCCGAPELTLAASLVALRRWALRRPLLSSSKKSLTAAALAAREDGVRIRFDDRLGSARGALRLAGMACRRTAPRQPAAFPTHGTERDRCTRAQRKQARSEHTREWYLYCFACPNSHGCNGRRGEGGAGGLQTRTNAAVGLVRFRHASAGCSGRMPRAGRAGPARWLACESTCHCAQCSVQDPSQRAPPLPLHSARTACTLRC